MRFEEIEQMVTDESFEDAVERLSPGELRVGVLDRFERVTPEMFHWWISNMEADTYTNWHPQDHKEFAWLGEHKPGRHVGDAHMTVQTLGGSTHVMRSSIAFVEPSEWFDDGVLEKHDATAICGVLNTLDENDQPREAIAGYLCHVLLPRDSAAEMRTCAFLNIAESGDVEAISRGRIKHIHQECGYLDGFLPELYEASQ